MYEMWTASVKNNHINEVSNSKSAKGKTSQHARPGRSPGAHSDSKKDEGSVDAEEEMIKSAKKKDSPTHGPTQSLATTRLLLSVDRSCFSACTSSGIGSSCSRQSSDSLQADSSQESLLFHTDIVLHAEHHPHLPDLPDLLSETSKSYYYFGESPDIALDQDCNITEDKIMNI